MSWNARMFTCMFLCLLSESVAAWAETLFKVCMGWNERPFGKTMLASLFEILAGLTRWSAIAFYKIWWDVCAGFCWPANLLKEWLRFDSKCFVLQLRCLRGPSQLMPYSNCSGWRVKSCANGRPFQNCRINMLAIFMGIGMAGHAMQCWHPRSIRCHSAISHAAAWSGSLKNAWCGLECMVDSGHLISHDPTNLLEYIWQIYFYILQASWVLEPLMTDHFFPIPNYPFGTHGAPNNSSTNATLRPHALWPQRHGSWIGLETEAAAQWICGTSFKAYPMHVWRVHFSRAKGS